MHERRRTALGGRGLHVANTGTPPSVSNTCKSGLCLDRSTEAPAMSTQTRCSAVCRVNADCGVGQFCQFLLLSNNDTMEGADDAGIGLCTAMAPVDPMKSCNSDMDCAAPSNACDTNPLVKACFKSTANPGDACASDAECPQGGRCLDAMSFPTFVGGYCVIDGCDPDPMAMTSGCPMGSKCAPTGAGTGTCLKGCAMDSDCRMMYTCQDSDDDMMNDACLP
jgi:hypothetical protein